LQSSKSEVAVVIVVVNRQEDKGQDEDELIVFLL
jgi:hypothetical protein